MHMQGLVKMGCNINANNPVGRNCSTHVGRISSHSGGREIANMPQSSTVL